MERKEKTVLISPSLCDCLTDLLSLDCHCEFFFPRSSNISALADLTLTLSVTFQRSCAVFLGGSDWLRKVD